MRHLVPVILTTLSVCAPSVSGAEDVSLPYSLSVLVDYGEPKGPDSVVDEIRRRLARDLVSKGWFEEVREVEPAETVETDLLLRITLDDLRRETLYDHSMAQQRELTDPISRMAYTVEWEVTIAIDLFVLPEGVTVRSTRFRESNARRPHYVGEDTEAAVRDEALRDVVRSIRGSAFKGSVRKLEQRIEKKRKDAATDAR